MAQPTELREQAAAAAVPVQGDPEPSDLIRAPERVDTDLAEALAELDRVRHGPGVEKR